MLPVSALKSMRVMFATPCYISAVTMNYVASIFSLTLDSAHLGLPCILHLHSESLIPRGRNKMVMKFLSEEFTHSVLDRFRHRLQPAVGLPPVAGGPRHRRRRLSDEEFQVAGRRRSRRHDAKAVRRPIWRIPIQSDRSRREPGEPVCRRRGLRRGGGGADRIYGDQAPRVHGDDEAVSGAQLRPGRSSQPSAGAPALAFFRLHGRPRFGRYLSEDYAFCRRWRDMGGKIWVDLDCKLMHLGQHLFGGDLAESLRAQGRW